MKKDKYLLRMLILMLSLVMAFPQQIVITSADSNIQQIGDSDESELENSIINENCDNDEIIIHEEENDSEIEKKGEVYFEEETSHEIDSPVLDTIVEDSGATASSDIIVYDAANFTNMASRSKQDVINQYALTQAVGESYDPSEKATYYDEQASTVAPYNPGVLSNDTLLSMEAYTNFFRWLIGVRPLTSNKVSNRSLQTQALDRNFQFDHIISDSKKPEDMDQSLWDEGFKLDHNILSRFYTASGSIQGFINEGYDADYNMWGTVGHRQALLSPYVSSMEFGYCGFITVGKIGASENIFDNAFSAFPAPGYMPSEMVSTWASSWTVQLNDEIVKCGNNVEVVIRHLETGNEFERTASNSNLRYSSSFIDFVQPYQSNLKKYQGNYDVEITGLIDISTGKEAKIHYTVKFFDIDPSLITNTTITMNEKEYEYSGSQIKPEIKVRDGSKALKEGVDYSLLYVNNTNPGYGVVLIKGKGNYYGTAKKAFKISKDIHTMEIVESVPPANDGEKTKVSRKCKVCGYTDIIYVKTMSYFNLWWWRDGIGYSYMRWQPKEGEVYEISMRDFEPEDAENKELELISSDESIMMIEGFRFAFVGTGKVTLTIRAKYDPSVYIIGTFDVEHAYDEVINKEATCTTSGNKTCTCNICGHVEVKEIPAFGHSNVIESYKVANLEDPYATLHNVCTVCGYKEDLRIKTLTSFSVWWWHDYYGYYWITNTPVEGDQYRISFEEYYPDDADNTELELISSDESIMEIDGSFFTFVGTGEVTLTIRAKYNPSTKIIKTFNVQHAYDEVIQKEATCTTKGQKLCTCKVCGNVEEMAISAHGHNYESTVIKEPTQTSEGIRQYTCSYCNKSFTENIPNLGGIGVEKLFSDVEDYQWYTSYIQSAYTKGLMSGYSNTTKFGPNDTVTRAQMVQVLYNMAGKPRVTDYSATEKFYDIYSDVWYEDAVNWAYSLGITVGMGNVFGADFALTREQMVTFFRNYASIKVPSVNERINITNYIDYNQVDVWARENMSWGVAIGLISGVERGNTKYLDPLGNATRAQLATVLTNYSEYYYFFFL